MRILHRKEQIKTLKQPRGSKKTISASQQNKERIKKIKIQLKGTKQAEEEERTCCICNTYIKRGQTYEELPPDITHQHSRFYHQIRCGPGTENWYKFHPSDIAYLLWKDNSKERKK